MRAEGIVQDGDHVASAATGSEERVIIAPSAASVGADNQSPSLCFSYRHFHELAQNEHSRYGANAPQVAYLIEEVSDRRAYATTFKQLPESIFLKPDGFTADGDAAPTVVAVDRFDAVKLPNGKMAVRANANGVTMFARRRYHFSITVNDKVNEYTFYPLSPVNKSVPDFYGPMPLTTKFNNTEAGEKLAEFAKDNECIVESGDVVIRKEDIPVRAMMTRNPSQEGVMGKKGIEIYRECSDQYEAGLSKELTTLLRHSANVMHLQTLRAKERRQEEVDPDVRRGVFRDRLLRTELLHGSSYTLSQLFSYLLIYKGKIYHIASRYQDKPDNPALLDAEKEEIVAKTNAVKEAVELTGTHSAMFDLAHPLYQHVQILEALADQTEQVIENPLYANPQRVDNLGAARACHNTDMMVLERSLKWFALNVANSVCLENTKRKRFLDTKVDEYIYFFIAITFNNTKIRVTQEIDALEKNPQYAKASDLAGLIGTLVQLVNGVSPVRQEKVKILPDLQALSRPRLTLFQGSKRERGTPVNDESTQEERLQQSRPL